MNDEEPPWKKSKTLVGVGPRASAEVAADDMVRVVLQFLREQGLTTSARALQRESGVGLTGVESPGDLGAWVRSGKWEGVLSTLSWLEVPRELCIDVHELVALELADNGESDLALEVVGRCRGMPGAERLKKLEWGDETKQARRARLAAALEELPTAPTARLETVVGQALRWRAHVGSLDSVVDLFLDSKRDAVEEERPIKKSAGAIRFGDGKPRCAAFLPGSQSLLATGSSDGFVEIWDCDTCRLCKDLAYQAADELLMHDAAVIALAPSRDAQALASGDDHGVIKVWKIASGTCARKFPKCPAGITALDWGPDEALFAGCGDGSLRLFGFKSGTLLQQFRGHTAYVTSLVADRDTLASASGDGTVRVWDARSAQCLHTVEPLAVRNAIDKKNVAHDRPVVAILRLQHDSFVVVTNSPLAVVLPLRAPPKPGMTTFSTLDTPKKPPAFDTYKPGASFVSAALTSPKGDFLLCLADDALLYVFDTRHGGSLDRVLQTAKHAAGANLSAVVTHPGGRNLAATFGDSDELRLWRSSSS